MLDTELKFRSNGSWQKNCPGIQDNGIWYFNGDETKITAIPGIGSGFHGDSSIYEVVNINDNTFQLSCSFCLPGYIGGVETLRAK